MKRFAFAILAVLCLCAVAQAGNCRCCGPEQQQPRQFRTPVRSYFAEYQPVRSTLRAWFIPMVERQNYEHN